MEELLLLLMFMLEVMSNDADGHGDEDSENPQNDEDDSKWIHYRPFKVNELSEILASQTG